MTIAQSIERKDKLRRADDEFSARLGFLSAAIGQPHFPVSPKDIDHKLIAHHVARGRRLRASAIRNSFKWVAGRTTQGIASLFRHFKDWNQHRRGMKELIALNDHMLMDIGLTRGDVESLANGTISASEINARRSQIANLGKRSCKVYSFESARSEDRKEPATDHRANSPNIDLAA